ncbi:hypothetical protein Tco_1502853 [Tanacetum coccineum]
MDVLYEEYDNIQASIDADALFAAKIQQEEREQFTIEERAQFLVETIAAQRKFRVAQRAVEIRSKPPTKTQMRNLMMTYLKNMGGYKHSQLKGKTMKYIHREKEDSSSKSAKGSRKKSLARKRAGEKQKEENAKRQKIEATTEEQESAESDEEEEADYEQEKEELRMWLTIVTDEEETNLGRSEVEDLHVYKIIRADGNTSYHKSLSSMLRKFDRQDLIDLHRLVMTIFEDKAPEGYNLLLWGDLKIMFEPNAKDEIWSNQQDWTLISWKLYESCGVHSLLLDGTLTCFNMLVEKRYPLIKEMLQKMLNWKLEAEAESTMAFELLKFIKSQLEE